MKKYEQITVHVNPGFTEKLDKMAEKLNLTRSQLVRNLLESAYEDAVILDKIGVIAAVQAFKELNEIKRKFFEKLSKGK